MNNADSTAQRSERVMNGAFFRSVLGRFPTGVVAVTATDDHQQPVGMVVGSFTSVSLDPPLVAYLPSKSSSTYTQLRKQNRFCVSVLSDRQQDDCRDLAIKKGSDKFSAARWRASPLGSPIYDDAVAWIDCMVEAELDVGDHYIVIGRVVDLQMGQPASPLIFHNGGYGRFSPQSRVLSAEHANLQQVRLADLARGPMEVLSTRLNTECAAMSRIDDAVVRIASVGTPTVGAAPIQVGQRLPFNAPLGALLVAWEDEQIQRQWVFRGAADVENGLIERHLEALARVRERGWLVSLNSEAYATLDDVLSNEPETPERLSKLRELEPRLGGPNAYDHDVLADKQLYSVRNLSAPVFDASGKVCLYISLFGLRESLAGVRILEVAEQLMECADDVGKLVAAADVGA